MIDGGADQEINFIRSSPHRPRSGVYRDRDLYKLRHRHLYDPSRCLTDKSLLIFSFFLKFHVRLSTHTAEP